MRRVRQLACVLFVITGSGGVYADNVWLAPITDPLSSVPSLLRNEVVQKELHIEAEQWPKIERVLDQWKLVLPDLDALSPEERDKRIDQLLDNADLSISTEDALARALTSAQQTRLNQLLLQESGADAFVFVSVSRQLELTDEQQRKISGLLRGRRASSPAQLLEQREQEMKDVLDVLTPEQRAAWDKLIGPNFDVLGVLRGTARRPVQFHSLTLLHRKEVQRELVISEDQAQRIGILWVKIRTEAPAFKRPRSAEEERAAVAERDKNTRLLNVITKRARARVLSPEQLQRLGQLELQRRGPWAFADQAIADQLALTEEQRQRVAELGLPKAPRRRVFQVAEAERRAIRDADERLKSQLTELLTPEQRSAWEKMLGPKFDFAFLQNRPGALILNRE